MKRNVVCYEEDTPALTIYEFLARVVIRGVVIVKHGSPTGLITRGCLLRFFMNLLAARRSKASFRKSMRRPASWSSGWATSAQDRIAKTVRSLAAEACDMESRLTQGDGDLVPCVVGGASRMQELVIDLLAISRFAQDWDDGPAADRPAAAGRKSSGAMRFARQSPAAPADVVDQRCPGPHFLDVAAAENFCLSARTFFAAGCLWARSSWEACWPANASYALPAALRTR